MNAHLHALVLAGGSGTRFWPWSRKIAPKQLLALDGRQCLLEVTLDRLHGLVEEENRWILTRADLTSAVTEALEDFPIRRILAEPEGRDTAPALVLGAWRIARENPDALLLALPSDHHIEDVDAFQATMNRAISAIAVDDGLYTFGMTPSEPATGFGYIERGAQAADAGVYQVAQFCEKPNRATAEEFLASGDYYWNSGMFLWKAATFLEELQAVAPEFGAGLEALNSLPSEGVDDDQFLRAFQLLPKTSIDYALLERSERVRVVEANFPWDDVGTWEAVSRLREGTVDPHGNCLDSDTVAVDSRESVTVQVDSNRTVVLLGVEDLLVVDTPDALLVCPRDRSQDVKEVVERLLGEGREDLV